MLQYDRDQNTQLAGQHGVVVEVATDQVRTCRLEVIDEATGSRFGCSESKIKDVVGFGPKGLKDLGIREWVCGDCGAVHDRDVNAARNILRLGRQTLAGGSSTHTA